MKRFLLFWSYYRALREMGHSVVSAAPRAWRRTRLDWWHCPLCRTNVELHAEQTAVCRAPQCKGRWKMKLKDGRLAR